MKSNYVIIVVRSRGKLVTTLMTIESAEKECKLLSHTTKHSKDFAIVIKSVKSVKYGARLSILLSIFKPEHYSILIYTRDIPTPYKAQALNNFFKNVSFQMS